MNSIATCSQSELAHAALHSPARSVFPSNYRVREIASDVALVVAVLNALLILPMIRVTKWAMPATTRSGRMVPV